MDSKGVISPLFWRGLGELSSLRFGSLLIVPGFDIQRSLAAKQPNGRDPMGKGEAIFSSRGCANAISATTESVAQGGLAQIHNERDKVSRFSLGEAHGRRIKKSNNRRSCNEASLHG